jgi:hypothetical protein
MLREQDDPRSLLGKASDDSVLAPNRKSRLMDFGYTPGRTLADIAEVSSIRETASIRPPFAQERTNSFVSVDGYGTDDDSSHNGSVMNRSRPGEGNNLFGGRQKIYKIPMASESGTGLKGRFVYDDDVSMSTFQKWRQEERERIARETPGALEADSPGKAAPLSPSLPGSITRQTSSSTSTSAPYNGRGSTAATSVNSQISNLPSSTPATTTSYASTTNGSGSGSPALDRSNTKSKRLYDQGLYKDIEEQQSTAMNRLNSIQKGRGRVSPPFGNAQPRGAYAEPTQSSSPHRVSPTLVPPSSFPAGPFSATDRQPVAENNPPSPLDTFTSALGSSLNPNDRGKATALGTFNKPQAFNEKQYLERQLTLRKELGNPSSRLAITREEPKASLDLEREHSSSATNSMYSTRSRAPTVGSIQQDAPTAFSVFQNAAQNLRRPETNPDPEESEAKTNFSFPRISSGSVFDNEPPVPPHPFDAPTPIPRVPQVTGPAPPPDHEHPAFKARNSGAEQEATIPKPRAMNFSTPFVNRRSNASSKNTQSVVSIDRDSNCLSVPGPGLSGLIRTHLRQDSGSSSIYAPSIEPPPMPILPKMATAPAPRAPSPPPTRLQPIETIPAEPAPPHAFDVETSSRKSSSTTQENSPPETVETSPKMVKQGRRRGMSISPDAEESWQAELKRSHIRGPSAETIQEQDALSVEIAKRQRAIQERLQAAKMQSGAAVATPPEEKQSFGPFRGLELLRNKSSKESIKREPQAQGIGSSKAGKMLGLASERPSFQADRWRSEESMTSQSSSIRSRSTSRPAAGRSSGQRHVPQVADSVRPSMDMTRPSLDERPVTRDRKNSNAPISVRNSGRSRSGSQSQGATTRSRSRTGKPHMGHRSKEVEEVPLPSEQPSLLGQFDVSQPKRSLDQGHGLQIQTGRAPVNVPFESQGLFPPPQPSPMSLSSNTSSPILPIQGAMLSPQFPLSPRQSPNSFSPAPAPIPARPAFPPNGVATPPLSGTNTPVMGTTPVFPNVPISVAPGAPRARSQSRKRSIQKSDIGEPRLISTTSVIDTISLPPGASLKNGMDEVNAPPVPPINPMRKKFGFSGSGRERNITPEANARLDEYLAHKSQGYVPSGRSISSSGSAGSGGSGGGTITSGIRTSQTSGNGVASSSMGMGAAPRASEDSFYPLSSQDTSAWKPSKGRFAPGHGLRKSSSEGERLGQRIRDQQRMQMQMQAELRENLKSSAKGVDPPVDGGMF